MSLSIRSVSTCVAMAILVALVPNGTSAPFDDTIRIRSTSGHVSRSFETRGAVEFTDDDRDVETLSPGGYLLIEEGSWFRAERSYEVRATSSGLSRTYRVGGRVRPVDADGQAWVSAAMLAFIRESGVGAGPRIERLLKHGGPQAVLKEVSEIHSDGSKRIYLRELVERGRLGAEHLRDAMRSARTIGSD